MSELDIIIDEKNGNIEFVEIFSDDQALKFRKDVIIPYFKEIFKVLLPLLTPSVPRRIFQNQQQIGRQIHIPRSKPSSLTA